MASSKKLKSRFEKGTDAWKRDRDERMKAWRENERKRLIDIGEEVAYEVQGPAEPEADTEPPPAPVEEKPKPRAPRKPLVPSP